MNWTLGIALYGAVIATASLGWTIYKSIRDRGSFLIDIYHVDLIFGDGTNVGKRIAIITTNNGTKPMKLRNVNIKSKYGQAEVVDTNLPIMLNPGEAHTTYINENKMLYCELEWVGSVNTLGKIFYVEKKILKKFNAECRKALTVTS